MISSNVLVCCNCGSRFSEQHAVKGQYIFETRVCVSCYQTMYKTSPTKCCFGKLYDKDSIVCVNVCPDSSICSKVVADVRIIHLTPAKLDSAKKFLQVGTKDMSATKIGNPYRQDSNIGQLFEFLKKRRTTDEIKKQCKKLDCQYAWAMRQLRSETYRGYAWKLSEKERGFKIYESL